MTNQTADALAEATLIRGTAEYAVEFLGDRTWEAPPEPDWMPESRNWALVSAETCAKVIDLALTDIEALTDDDAFTIVEAILYHMDEDEPGDFDQWRNRLGLVPNVRAHLARADADEALLQQELADIEAGRSRIPFDPQTLGVRRNSWDGRMPNSRAEVSIATADIDPRTIRPHVGPTRHHN